MPFRTKDFMLFIVVVAFLLVAITGVIANDLSRASYSNQASAIGFVTDTSEYQAEVSLSESNLDRQNRLASLKRAVEDRKQNQPPVSISEVVVDIPVVDIVTSESPIPRHCANYSVYDVAWSTSKLSFEVIEGARLLFREVEPVTVEGLSDTDSPAGYSRQVVLQLPLQSSPAINDSCLTVDVVGIALDGSLIRNNESNIYGIFSDSTLVGYALDGFPIYGHTTRQTDTCGGTSVDGEYKYFINKNRDSIINCFSGLPVALSGS